MGSTFLCVPTAANTRAPQCFLRPLETSTTQTITHYHCLQSLPVFSQKLYLPKGGRGPEPEMGYTFPEKENHIITQVTEMLCACCWQVWSHSLEKPYLHFWLLFPHQECYTNHLQSYFWTWVVTVQPKALLLQLNFVSFISRCNHIIPHTLLGAIGTQHDYIPILHCLGDCRKCIFFFSYS